MLKINIPVKYRVLALLPRTEENLQVFEGTDLELAVRYCEKNIKYFPRLILRHGAKGLPGFAEDVYENEEFRDRSRDAIRDAKIGRIKKKTRFKHQIVFESETKVAFLVKYKRNESRVCIIDAKHKEAVMNLIRCEADHYRIKIHRGALPIVYFRHHAKDHTTIFELAYGKKKIGYVNFKDGNPYNYMESNLQFVKVAVTRNRNKPATGYYGVLYLPNEKGNKKYVANIYIKGVCTKVGRFSDPISAAKAYDRARMETYGRAAAKNFPYEYYAAFEPSYVSNVT